MRITNGHLLCSQAPGLGRFYHSEFLQDLDRKEWVVIKNELQMRDQAYRATLCTPDKVAAYSYSFFCLLGQLSLMYNGTWLGYAVPIWFKDLALCANNYIMVGDERCPCCCFWHLPAWCVFSGTCLPSEQVRDILKDKDKAWDRDRIDRINEKVAAITHHLQFIPIGNVERNELEPVLLYFQNTLNRV